MALLRKKWMLAVLALAVAITTAASILSFKNRYPRFNDEVNALALDLAHPDALIRSSSLSRLPSDLLRIPLMRDVLTEDFVDYYEHNGQREALLGTLKRITYEHKLSFSEQLLREVFDEPAEIALWRDESGRLSRFTLAMTRNTLAKAISLLLPLSDAQISSAGMLPGGKGGNVPLLILEYGVGRRLLLAAQGDRVVALSDPGMLLAAKSANEAVPDGGTEAPAQSGAAATVLMKLLDAQKATPNGEGEPEAPAQSGAAAAVLMELLDARTKLSPFARRFGLIAPLAEKEHEITLADSALAFGYESFGAGLDALDFRFDATGRWHSAARAAADFPSGENLWSAMPRGAGLCAALRMSKERLAVLLENFNANPGGSPLPAGALANIDDAAAVCWYGKSRLYAPLFAARQAASPEARINAAQNFFDLATRFLYKMDTAEPRAAGTRGSAKPDAQIWRGEASAGYDLVPALGASVNDTAFFFFSPDDALVDKALDVAANRYPAIADDFPDAPPDAVKSTPDAATGSAPDAAKSTLAVLNPPAIASLLRRELYAALPRGEEPDFRNAADAWLTPRLDALARYPAQRVLLTPGKASADTRSGSQPEWRRLVWEPLRPSAAPDQAARR